MIFLCFVCENARSKLRSLSIKEKERVKVNWGLLLEAQSYQNPISLLTMSAHLYNAIIYFDSSKDSKYLSRCYLLWLLYDSEIWKAILQAI